MRDVDVDVVERGLIIVFFQNLHEESCDDVLEQPALQKRIQVYWLHEGI
jgi:hypothetical protein